MTAILVRLPNWVGDAAMSLPALAAIRRHWPSAGIDLMSHPRVASLAAFAPGIRACRTVPVRGGTGWPELIQSLRAGAYDLGILLTPSFSSALLFSLGGVVERVGRRGQGRDWLLSTPLPSGNRTSSQVSQYVEVVRAMGYDGPDPPLALAPDEASRQTASVWLKSRGIEPGRFLAIAPGAAYGPAKLWPPGRFASVASAMHQRRHWPTVLIGAPVEQEILDEVAAAIGNDVYLFDRPALPEVVALLALAGALVANDTGALHLGRVAGTVVVGLFTSTSPEWTGPSSLEGESVAAGVSCRPCFRRRCPLASGRYACLTAVEPAAVVDAVERQLDRRAVTA